MKKALLFDLDNTLYDYEFAHNKALKEVYSVLRKEIKIPFKKFMRLFKISKEEIKRELGGTASAHNRVLYFQRLVEKTHNTVEPSVSLRLYNAYWNTFLRNMRLDEGVIETFKQLRKKGIKIAIVSDLTTNIQLRKIESLKLNSYVDVLVTSEEAGNEKPHPIMFLLTLNKLDLLPKDCLMVGDHPIKDIEGANAVGLDTALLTRGKVEKFDEDYKKPNHVIRNISAVLKIIE